MFPDVHLILARGARFFFLLFALLACASSVHAALQVDLEAVGLSNEQRQASQRLLDDTLRALPPLLTSQLDRRITLRWSDRLPDSVMGRARFDGLILLNRRWLDALVKGHDQVLPPGRQHPGLRRELQATLVHELAHFYDRGPFWSAEQRRWVRYCSQLHASTRAVGLPYECFGQAQRRFTLSDDPRLLELAGWPARIGGRGEVEADNHQYLRSPDAYELSNPREFVAVNLEYFILDPEYPCRRPGLYAYFRAHFGWAPPGSADCAPGYSFVNAGLDSDRPALGWLDPERIYQVHYLLAEPNDAWVSRWGHSMLRVVMCAPGRPPGPECLMDLDHHLVLSFRAFVEDVQLSSWDGLTGAYPSRLFMLPLNQVVDEYTKVELRPLQSLPLKLTQHQQRALVERAAELHWGYDGTYYFVSNNCAVETLKLLRSGTDRQDIRTLQTVTPTGLLALLKRQGLVDESVLQDRREALRQGYYFDSYRERYQLMFGIARERLTLPQEHMEDWLALAPDQRQRWFGQADSRTTAALLLLEQAALRRQVLLIQQALKERYMAGQRSDNALKDTGGLMRQLLKESSFLSRPAELLQAGYGLPQAGERKVLEKVTDARQRSLQGLVEALDERVLQVVSHEQRSTVEAGQRNVEYLVRHLRQLHQETGGLRLP